MSVNDQRVNRRQNFDRFNRLAEWPMVCLALILVPILIIENESVDPTLLTVAYTLNWIIWLAFCAEYFTKLILAPQRLKFIRIAWLDLVIILLSPPFLPTLFESTRTLRLLRVLRLLRILAVAGLGLRLLRKLLGRHQFHYLGSIAVGLVVLCGVREPVLSPVGVLVPGLHALGRVPVRPFPAVDHSEYRTFVPHSLITRRTF